MRFRTIGFFIHFGGVFVIAASALDGGPGNNPWTIPYAVFLALMCSLGALVMSINEKDRD